MYDGKVVDIENPEEHFRKLTGDTNLVNLIGLILPPRYGVMLFATSLEYGLFPPGTPLNDLFMFHLNTFKSVKLVHICIPSQYFERAKALAYECEIRFVNSPVRVCGPMVFSSKEEIEGSEAYPHFDPATTYTLENIPGSKIYTASPDEVRRLLEEERRQCNDIITQRRDVVIPIFH